MMFGRFSDSGRVALFRGLMIWRLGVAVLAVGGAIVFEARAQQASELNLNGEQPVISFVQPRHDFGTIYRGQKVQHSFEFANTGKGVLEIRSIHASCGCINTQVQPQSRFEPGQKGSIVFEFDSTNFADEIVKVITVDTNETTHSTSILTMTATVRHEVRAIPALVNLGTIEKGSKVTRTVELQLSGKAAVDPNTKKNDELVEKIPQEIKAKIDLNASGLVIGGVTSSSPNIIASLVGTKEKPQISIQIAGNLPIQPLRERVSVWTNSTYLKELVIPVVGEVVGHVRQSTKYIEFGVVKKGQSAKRNLTLESSNRSFKVENVQVEFRRTDAMVLFDSAQVVDTNVMPTATGFSIAFYMKFPDKMPAALPIANVSGYFVVKTNDPDYDKIRVPFFGVLKQE